jgi:hypothetical protein
MILYIIILNIKIKKNAVNSSGLIHELNHDDYISYSDIKIRYR